MRARQPWVNHRKGLHDMIPVLRELNMFVGMDTCKQRVIQQIIYFSQNLHETPAFPIDKGESANPPDLFSSFTKKKNTTCLNYTILQDLDQFCTIL